MRIVENPSWHGDLTRELERRMDRLVEQITEDARRYAPVDTGELRSKIVWYRAGDGAWRVHSQAWHTLWVEYPTRPHVITARPGGVLRFRVGGRVVYARQVRHPGTAAQPFLRPALFQERVL